MEQKKREHLIIVDDNPVNLDLAESVLKENYKLTKLISGQQLFKMLSRIHPDLILLDIHMPDLNGYEILEAITQHPDWSKIPVIFLTGQDDIASEREGFRLGAKDFIRKPFDSIVMLARVRSQLDLYQYQQNLETAVQEKTAQIEKLQHMITVSWAEVIESRDGTTGSHVRNTTLYFQEFLNILSRYPSYAKQFTPDKIDALLRASSLHDIGKVAIRDEVLKKPGPLNTEELTHMMTHSETGASMIQKIINETSAEEFLLYAKDMALYHHEKWDGTGYPCGLKGNEIPLFVQALSIADVFDALTSVRSYKPAFTLEETYNIMKTDRENFFSPELFDIFWEHKESMKQILAQKQP